MAIQQSWKVRNYAHFFLDFVTQIELIIIITCTIVAAVMISTRNG